MRELNVIGFENKKSLTEIYQKTGMMFSFCSKSKKDGKMYQCHPWVKCRDFLHDAMRAQLLSKKMDDIWGFSFSEENPRIDFNKIRILVGKQQGVYGSDTFDTTIKRALRILNVVEKFGKISLTKKFKVNMEEKGTHKTAAYMFVGSKEWMQSSFMVSLYTLLIRIGDKDIKFKSNMTDLIRALKESIENTLDGDRDDTYLKHIINKIEVIVSRRYELLYMENGFKSYMTNKDFGKYNFHDRSGIVSLSNTSTADPNLNKKLKEIFKDAEGTNPAKG